MRKTIKVTSGCYEGRTGTILEENYTAHTFGITRTGTLVQLGGAAGPIILQPGEYEVTSTKEKPNRAFASIRL